jgi:ketosteroid isomerase-like protein
VDGRLKMRRPRIGFALVLIVVALAACGEANGDTASEEAVARQADYWAIGQIQKHFHEATSKKDIDLMMSLYAPNATLTIPGRTAVGTEEIRAFWLTKSDAFRPDNHWLSETPSYKTEITANGDKGTLHFECHYVDIEGKTVVVYLTTDQEVARIDGEWLISDMVVGSASLKP